MEKTVTIPLNLAEKAYSALCNSVDLVVHEYQNDWRHGIPSREKQLKALEKMMDEHISAAHELHVLLTDVPEK